MFYKDYELVKSLHEKYAFKAPLLEPGGLAGPSIANYEISIDKAYRFTKQLNGIERNIVVPHEQQRDRYERIRTPWEFIDPKYRIENPAEGGCPIEDLPEYLEDQEVQTIICVSVFEHVQDPFICSDALFKVLKSGGYFFNSVPFIFPQHDAVDNWRYSPDALRYMHEKSGFEFVEGGTHINYKTTDGIGDYHNADHLQAIQASYCLVRKP